MNALRSSILQKATATTAFALLLAAAGSVAAGAPESPPAGNKVAEKPQNNTAGKTPATPPKAPQTPAVRTPETPRGGSPDQANNPKAARNDGVNRVTSPASTDNQNVAPNNVRDARDATRSEGDSSGSSADQERDRLREDRGNNHGQHFRGAADIGLVFSRFGDGLVVDRIGTVGAISTLGFQAGDRLVSVNGQRVANEADFMSFLFAPELSDRRVAVIVQREGLDQTIYVEPRLFVDDDDTVRFYPLERVGLVVDDRLTDRVAVLRVLPHSPAYVAGIRAGDVVVSFRGTRVQSPQEFAQLFDSVEPGGLAIQVDRNNRTRNLALEVVKPVRTATLPTIGNRR